MKRTIFSLLFAFIFLFSTVQSASSVESLTQHDLAYLSFSVRSILLGMSFQEGSSTPQRVENGNRVSYVYHPINGADFSVTYWRDAIIEYSLEIDLTAASEGDAAILIVALISTIETDGDSGAAQKIAIRLSENVEGAISGSTTYTQSSVYTGDKAVFNFSMQADFSGGMSMSLKAEII